MAAGPSLFFMRLDIFLKLSRLIPRRSLAQEFCDAGRIAVNGSDAKSAKEVKAGDLITIKRRDRKTVVRVESVPEKKQLSKAFAAELYALISDEAIDDLP